MAHISIPGLSSSNSSEREFKAALQELPLGGLRFFEAIGSTNDEALAWAADGARDMSLVFADQQMAGRGRMGRKWFTPGGSALAFSLIMRPRGFEREMVGLFSGLGALALVDALKFYDVQAQIKWPNDVLIKRKKVAGILVETVWLGTNVDSVVLGMGVNVARESIPPEEGVNFPAACVQTEVRKPVPRFELLQKILAALLVWRARLASDEFLRAWETSMAFRGEAVQVWLSDETVTGQVLGLETDGSLQLELINGEKRTIRFGEVHLRPL